MPRVPREAVDSQHYFLTPRLAFPSWALLSKAPLPVEAVLSLGVGGGDNPAPGYTGDPGAVPSRAAQPTAHTYSAHPGPGPQDGGPIIHELAFHNLADRVDLSPSTEAGTGQPAASNMPVSCREGLN